MKACVYIKTAKRGRGRAQTLSLIKHCIGEGRSQREIDDGQSRVALIEAFGLVGSLDEYKLGALRDNLLRQNHDSKSKEAAKHVVLSVEDTLDPAARRAALRILRRMAMEFLKVYAPGCAALAFAHNDRKHPHLHLVIANSNGYRALNWKPKVLRQMQSMEWLSKDLQIVVQSGRRASRKVSHEPYPTAKLSLAAELAALPKAELEKISWEVRGNTRVFTYKGRRVRERTVERERERISNETIARHRAAGGVSPGTPATPGTADARGATTDACRGDDTPAAGSGTAAGHRPCPGTNPAANPLLAQALQWLRQERRQRQHRGIEPPEIT
jgi:hypothetical protein